MQSLVNGVFVVVLVLIGYSAAWATAQRADRIIYNGEEKMLFTNPLEDHYKTRADRPRFMIEPLTISSGNWRGYVATWQVEEGKLYLTNIDSWICSGVTKDSCSKVQLTDLFPTAVNNGRVAARWFSGELRIPDGKLLQYVHGGYASTYERDIIISVKFGIASEPIVVDNIAKELLRY